MSNTIIKVENLSKQYRLGQIGTGSLAHDINRWWHKVRGNEDPYLKIGESNDRTSKGDSEYVWSLRDINFDIKQGDAVGIIGRNGAGKSTLLKILSRTTTPTFGNVKIKGRVASLLEVGTGFHPELTGRENIFLNGAILGMTKTEIKRKFDEIVDFAGVERYVDTPVKRYSSGMYVRLAFGVAAHLEPEILIVDEVLAVGDAEFQKKALGKMKDVSTGEGRTVLFVSHNMAAIKQLCNSGILLKNGMLAYKSNNVNELLTQYTLGASSGKADGSWCWKNEGEFKNQYITPEELTILPVEQGILSNDRDIIVQLSFSVKEKDAGLAIGIKIVELENEQTIFLSQHTDEEEEMWPIVNIGTNIYRIRIPSNLLNKGKYRLDVYASLSMRQWLIHPSESTVSVYFEIEGGLSKSPHWLQKRDGLIAPILKWEKAPEN